MSVIIDGSAGVTTNAGGSVNPSTNIDGINYSCRAWVNFNGTTSPITIRGSGNVSSITDNGLGQYTVNFTTAMPDTNYVFIADAGNGSTAQTAGTAYSGAAPTTSAARFLVDNGAGALVDREYVMAAVFR